MYILCMSLVDSAIISVFICAGSKCFPICRVMRVKYCGLIGPSMSARALLSDPVIIIIWMTELSFPLF